MEPDYKSYTLDELYDVKSNINKDAYPQRYKALQQELARREKAQPKVTVKETVKKPKRKATNKEKIISSAIMLIIVVVCIYIEKIPGKHDGYSMADDPYFFWGTLLLCVGFAVSQLLSLERNKRQSDTGT